VTEQERIEGLAQICTGQARVPLFTTAEVSAVVNVPAGTIRQWVNRGHVSLEFSERPGPGKAMLFSPDDLLEIAGFAELSRLGLPPGRFAADAAAMVMSRAGKKIHELAGVYGPWRQDMLDFQRFVLLVYDPSMDGLNWFFHDKPYPTGDGPLGMGSPAAWVAIDCFLLAMRALDALDQKVGSPHE
jgi:hypothetical protein